MNEMLKVSESESHILLAMDDGKANALGFAMFEALNKGLDQAEPSGKVVVVAGRPGKFSAGFDLTVMAEGGEPTIRLLKEGANLSTRLMNFSTPVILAVSGHALAMGALLCLSADYRIGMLGNYKIGLNEVAIGMTLPWFGVELARHRLTAPHFDKAVGLATIYDATGAVEAGYLDEAVEEDRLLWRAAEKAAELSTLNMAAHRSTKRRVREEFDKRYVLALERDFEEGASAN